MGKGEIPRGTVGTTEGWFDTGLRKTPTRLTTNGLQDELTKEGLAAGNAKRPAALGATGRCGERSWTRPGLAPNRRTS